jgi:single-stranded DNA-binding protein
MAAVCQSIREAVFLAKSARSAMSLHVLVSGALTADPARRTGANGKDFATATLRVATDDDAILVSVIAFGATTETLLAHRQGATLAVSGRAKLTNWTGRDGADHHGISVVVDQIASAASARRADAERRREKRDAA